MRNELALKYHSKMIFDVLEASFKAQEGKKPLFFAWENTFDTRKNDKKVMVICRAHRQPTHMARQT